MTGNRATGASLESTMNFGYRSSVSIGITKSHGPVFERNGIS